MPYTYIICKNDQDSLLSFYNCESNVYIYGWEVADLIGHFVTGASKILTWECFSIMPDMFPTFDHECQRDC